MALREFLLENFAGDLEYHPRRGVLYLGLGIATLCFWISIPSNDKLTAIPLVFGLGSLPLLLKGVFLLRKTSEGLGLTLQELALLSDPSTRKALPSIPALSAQIVQDFGTGALLLGPVLHVGNNINGSWELPVFPVFLIGAVLFLIGWLVRRFTSSKSD
jgi:hypothetical protein